MKKYALVFIVVLLTACKTNHLAVIKIDNKFGCIDVMGNIVVKPTWDYILQGGRKKPILVQKDSLYGYIDNKGRILIKPQYKDGDLFSEGLAAVSNGSEYGYINIKGDTIIDFQFQENAWGNFSQGLADVIINDRSGYIDKKGNVVIPLVFEICYPFKSSIAVVMDTFLEFKLVTRSGRILEYNNKNIGNKELLPPRYSYPGSIETKTGQGRVNDKGDTTVPPIYLVTGNLTDGMYIVKDKREKWGVYNKKGELIIEPIFDEIWHYNEGLANFKLNGKWGYVDKKGIVIIEPKFEYASRFTNGLAYAEINGKAGFIDKKGKFVIKPIFDINRGSRFE